MNEDLLKDTFCVEIDKSVISKNIQLLKIALVFISAYLLLAIYLWVKIFITMPSILKMEGVQLFKFIFSPIVLFLSSFLNISAVFYVLRGNKLLHTSIINNDAAIFNTGYNHFYKATIFSLITIIISLLFGLINFLVLSK